MVDSINPFLKEYSLKVDVNEEMDVAYGREYKNTHNVTTFKNASTIKTDTRLLKLYKTIMDEAIREKATDIQISDWGNYGLVRFRLGSKMVPYRILHKFAVESLILVFRDKAGVNPETVRNANIDGTIEYEYDNGEAIEKLDARLAFSPTVRGSMVDIRILYPARLDKTIDELGLAESVAHTFKEVVKSTEGLVVLTGSTGSGKALDVNTPIPMYLEPYQTTGFKKMGDLVVGDTVLDENGEPTKVTAVYDQPIHPCYEITFSDGTTLIADENHNWEVHNLVDNSSSILTTVEIYNSLDISSEGTSNHAIRTLQKSVSYPKRTLPLNPFVLGYWLVAGKNNESSDLRKDILNNTSEKIGSVLETQVPNSELFKNSLFALGLMDIENNLNKFIPDIYLYASEGQRMLLLYGILEALGHSELTKQTVDLNSLPTDFVKGFRILNHSLGYQTKDIESTTQLLRDFDDYRYIISCEPTESVPTRCITVDSLSHLFLCTESYIPTHNTTTQMTGIKQILVDSAFTKNIMTIENPVEYKMEGIVQSSVNQLHGYTFPIALRTILRQDPDVILVGEINDAETASTAIRAASSGHLVFTTVHANNVLEVPNALNQLGVSDRELGNSLRIIIYQTLKDRLCPYCKEQHFVSISQKRWMDSKLLGQPEQATFFKAREGGCDKCNHKGYLGRVMLNEMVEANYVYRIIKEQHGRNIDAVKKELLATEGANFYPLEYDVYRHLQEGNISFADATSMVGK